MESNIGHRRSAVVKLLCIAAAAIVAAAYILYAVKEYSVYLNYGYIRSHSLEIIADDSKYCLLAVLALIPAITAFAFFQTRWAEYICRGMSVKTVFAALVLVAAFDLIVVRPAFFAFTVSHDTERGGYLAMGIAMTDAFLLLPSCVSQLFRLFVAASFLAAIQRCRETAGSRPGQIAATVLMLYVIGFLFYHVVQLNYSQYYPVNMAGIECYSWTWYYTVGWINELCTKNSGYRGGWTVASLTLWLILFILTALYMGSIFDGPEVSPVQFSLWAYGVPVLALFLMAMVCIALIATYGWSIQNENTKCYTSVFLGYFTLKWLYAIMTLFIPDLYGDQLYVLPFSGPYAIMDWLCFGSCAIGFFQNNREETKNDSQPLTYG